LTQKRAETDVEVRWAGKRLKFYGSFAPRAYLSEDAGISVEVIEVLPHFKLQALW